jgi:hypothetical protein
MCGLSTYKLVVHVFVEKYHTIYRPYRLRLAYVP